MAARQSPPADDRGAKSVVDRDRHIIPRQTLFIEHESEWRTNIRGTGSWQLCRDAGGRRPTWSNASKSWTVSAATARRVVELAAQIGNLDVVITGPLLTRVSQTLESERPDPGQGLW